jgi:phosphoserine phosphatase RsbU/P
MAVILLLHQSIVQRRTLTYMLRGTGHRVTSTTSAEDAVKLCSRYGFDLLIVDVPQGEPQGIAALRALRKTPAGAQQPILAITNSGRPADHHELITIGASMVLPEPCSIEQFEAAIRLLTAGGSPSIGAPLHGTAPLSDDAPIADSYQQAS